MLGRGGFRDTWYISRVAKTDVEAILREEAELMRIVDTVAATADELEELASAIEGCDIESLPEPLGEAAMKEGLAAYLDEEIAPLDGLELGVAGLAYALGSLGCLTTASCRWHISVRSWSDCPVVFFAAPAWRLELYRRADRCRRLRTRRRSRNARDLRAIDPQYARLAETIAAERKRFGRKPDHWRTPGIARTPQQSQLELPLK